MCVCVYFIFVLNYNSLRIIRPNILSRVGPLSIYLNGIMIKAFHLPIQDYICYSRHLIIILVSRQQIFPYLELGGADLQDTSIHDQ